MLSTTQFVLLSIAWMAIFSTGCATKNYHKPYQMGNTYRIEHAAWPDCKVVLNESLVKCKCSEFMMETDAQTNDVVMKCPAK